MKKIIINKYLLLIIRTFLGFIFVFSGIQKILDPNGFSVAIENYKLFPIFLINLIAITIPWLELITGLLLILGYFIKENAAIINSLLILFIVLILIAIIRGLDIECGCFGTLDGQKIGLIKIIENSGLLLLGIYIYLTDEYQSIILRQNH